MSELITEQEIINARNEAYKTAGHNAYFGNGFTAGVKFALEKSHAPQMLEMLKEMNDSLIWCLEKLQENGNPYEVDFQLASECDKLIQQATTIK